MPVPETQPTSTQPVTFVTFHLGSQTYALPISNVQQIIEMVTITPLPQVDPAVVGVINFHGSLVPVLNMRRLLNLPDLAPTLHTPLIMVNVSDRLTGLLVDEVLDVLQRPADQVIDPNNILLKEMGQIPLIQGLIRVQDGSVLLMNPEQLLKPYSSKALSQAVDSLAQSLQQDSVEEKQESNLDTPVPTIAVEATVATEPGNGSAKKAKKPRRGKAGSTIGND
jgi:purine-binding chemotaxis protein CheW